MNLYPPQGHQQGGSVYGNNSQQQQMDGAGNPGGANYQKYVSPEMLNFGLSAGQDMISKQTEKWMPGVSGFWLSLKFYFSVSNSYVLKKCAIILYPINNKVWARVPADEYERNSEAEMYSRKWALPKQDVNSPDLYIPLMAFMTYVLLYGLSQGLGTTSTFTPDLLIQGVWRCLILQLIECGLIKLGVSMMSVSVPFLDLFSYTGYKYVHLCLALISSIFGGTIKFLISLYLSVVMGFFLLKTMASVIPQSVETGPPRHLVLLSFATMQFLVVLVLSWL